MVDWKIEFFQTPKGILNAKVRLGDKALTLHSVDPHKEAEKILALFNPQMKWILVAGFGLGYIVETILSRSSYNVIVYEHSPEIIEEVAQKRDLSAILKNPRVAFLQGDAERVTAFLTENHIKEIGFYIHRPYHTLFKEVYANLEGLLIAYLSKKQINLATLKRFQKVWLKNIIKNSFFYFNTPGICDLKHSLTSKPCVIVGAGPSLGKNIETLKEYSDKTVIIATDTALPMLCAANIRCDFVVSVDPQEKNTLFLLYATDKTPILVLEGAGSFVSLSRYNPSNTILFDSIFPLYEECVHYWGEKGRVLSGGSVSTTAFDLARVLGCDPIIMIGQDLAYSQKQTHFRGNVLEDFLYCRVNRLQTFESYNSKMLLLSDKIEIKGGAGEKVSTDRKFLTFLDWFVREIPYTKAQVINATEGGAYIEGATHLSLLDTAKRYMTESIDKAVAWENNPRTDEDYMAYLAQVLHEVERLIPYARDAVLSAKNALTTLRANQNFRAYFEAMNRFDQEMKKSLSSRASVARFIELTMQTSIEAILESAQATEINEDLVRRWVELYREAHEGLKRIRALLKKRLSLPKFGR